jgi:hypothetical protein
MSRFTIDQHEKRSRKIIYKDGMAEKAENVKEVINSTESGFIVRVDDEFLGFFPSKAEAMARIESEKKAPTKIVHESLSIESHAQRSRDEDGKIHVTPGFLLRAGPNVIAFSKNRSELVGMVAKLNAGDVLEKQDAPAVVATKKVSEPKKGSFQKGKK